MWGPALTLMALIFSVSSTSTPPALPKHISDVVAHAIVYSVLGALMLRGFARGRWCGITRRAVALSILVSALYGVSDEIHQHFVPGRNAEVRDVVADAIGAFFGTGLIWAWSIVLSTQQVDHGVRESRR